MKTLLRIYAIALLVSVSAMGFNTNANISVSRSPGTVSVPPGGSAFVTLTVDVGAIGGSPIRGFYLTEYIPAGFSITGDEVRINGLPVNGHLRETVEDGSIHAGFTAERWVLETPPSWSENHPVNAMSTVTITYQLQVPANAAIRAYSLPGCSWASMIPGIGDAGDDFGYEGTPPLVNVIETPPSMVTQPQDQTGYEGLTVTFTAGASGGSLSYQWRASGINIPGAAAASYTTATLTPADNGKIFDCIISNSAGQVTSRTATLTVLQGLFYTLKDNRFKQYVTLGAGSALSINGAAQADGQRFQKVDAGGGEYYLKLAGVETYVALGANDQMFATATGTATAARFADRDCAYNGDGGLGIQCMNDDDAAPYMKSLGVNEVGAANGTCSAADGTSWERFYFESVSGGDVAAPSVPAGVSAGAVSPSQINISWGASTDNVGVTAYIVEFREQGGTFALLTSTPGLSASAIGLAASTPYEFRVRAEDAAGNQSAWSTTASATTPGVPDTEAPSVPGNVSAAAVSASQINVTWSAAADNIGVTGYTVERRPAGGTFALLTSTAGLSASANGLSPLTAYEFRVRANDAAGNQSAWSALAAAATPGSSAPVRLSIVSADASSAQAPNTAANSIDGSMATRWAADGDGQWVRYRLSGQETVLEIRIAFYNGAARQTYFEIQVSDDGVNWTAAGGRQTSSGSTTALEVFNLPAASAQWVRYLGHGNSANTWNSLFEVEIYGSGAPPDGEAPTAPVNLSAAAVSFSRIDLSWNASTDNTAVTGYDVEYRAAGGSFAALAGTAGTSASATGLSPDTEYEFRVRAKDAAANLSAWSASALETTPAIPPDAQAPSVPSGVSAAAAGPYQVNISWSASSDNVGVTGYRVEYRAAGGSFSLLTAAAGTSASAAGLIPLTTYEFRVLAEDAAGNQSAWSVTASAATPDNSQPVKLTVISADASSAEAPNYAPNSIDGNAGTRWAAFGDGEWARYQMSAQAVVSSVKVSFYAGAARQTYFEIQVSNDGVNWTTIGGRQTSSGTTTGLETFDLPDTSAGWVRYLGHGNSVHAWNSIYELEVYGQP